MRFVHPDRDDESRWAVSAAIAQTAADGPNRSALFEGLHLQIAFQPAEATVDVEVLLFAD